MIDESLRERFHDFVNKVGVVSVKSQEFFFLYGGDLAEIDASTRDALFNALQEIDSCHSKMAATLETLSRTLADTVARTDWADAAGSIRNVLNDIHALYREVKDMSENISDIAYKEDIQKVAKKMKEFINLVESVIQLISGIREKLVSYGIYDYVYDETGKAFIRVLYCGTGQAFNDSVKEYFENREFIVYTAQDSETALRIVRNHRPLVAFIDIELKGIRSGLEALREIRQSNSKMKTVMITMLDLDEIKKILAEEKLDADYFFTKTVDLKELMAKARELTSRI